MKDNVIKREEVRDFILENVGNDVFWVKFRKRTSGEVRIMKCKIISHYFIRRIEWEDRKHNLITVYDVDKIKRGERAIRRISIDGIIELKIGNNIYKVVD